MTWIERRRNLTLPRAIGLSPNGEHLYVPHDYRTVLYERDAGTGLLAYADEVADLLIALEGMAFSPGGSSLYFAWGDSVSAYARDLDTGDLTRIGSHTNIRPTPSSYRWMVSMSTPPVG